MSEASLTEAQAAAVHHIDGPLLILAGPGSGKTRVVTHRIAHLTESGVPAGQILAITFTNKAAREMAERVQSISPGSRVWVSTFHSFCARLLRGHASAIGLTSNFSIYDTSDQHRLLREILHDLDIDPVHFPPAKIGNIISRAKNDLITADIYTRRFEETVGDHLQAVVARAYPAYQKGLLRSNAVDFDDLLLHVVALLQENDDLRLDLDERFRYILVDEYQDTNMAQYQIVRGLSQQYPNLCVTGDPDQSIYGWRGARIENILRFERDYPQTKIVRLEQNYRSTGEILKTADQLISHNQQRKPKALITDNPQGQPVELLVCENGNREAEEIAERIRQRVGSGERDYSDFAIFYRVNSLSRPLEMALTRLRVPYQIAAGVSFYERKEIKDLLAYLRVLHNPDDRVAFRRIVNTPPRGIGKKTLTELIRHADAEGISLSEAATRAGEIETLNARAIKAVRAFAGLMDEFSLAHSGSVEALLGNVIERSRYAAGWEKSLAEDDQQRMANVLELLAAARQYDQTHPEDGTLEEFLELSSLANEVDSIEEQRGHVTMMTLHAAKGLEFPVVFLVGLEQNLLPHERSIKTEDPREIEEERRLFFVGITRAEEELYLTRTKSRAVHGRELFSIPSDFLNEISIVTTHLTEPEYDSTAANGPTINYEEFSNEPEPGLRRTKKPKDPVLPKDLMAQLKTGASLLGDGDESEKPAVNLPVGFAEGMQVRHPRYGRGTVIRVGGGLGNRRTITVEFETDHREETFVASKCPLQPIG